VIEADALRALWEKTLGAKLDAPDLTPGRTYKPAEAEGTLSGGRTLPSAGTLSGGGTLAGGGTLSGGGTLAPVDAAGGGPGAPGGSRYELLQELGRGGMGVVFKARQESLDRDVAIKQLLGRQDDEHLRRRFLAEALVTGVLDHPNVVPVHELGLTPGGELFMAMKLVGGTSWADLLHPRTPEQKERAGRHDREAHVQTLLSVCNAVAFAHSRGIVHRDLKPENVMVGDFGEVLVMDWGIAVDCSPAPTAEARAPHRSSVVSPSGTPSYMPPELAEGRGAEIGPATDVYLLGACLHEVLTGAPPHQGKNLVEVLLAAARSAPPRYGPDVPQGLAAICAKAMARAPRDRHASVAAFQEELRAYLKHRESLLLSQRADEDLRALEKVGDEQRDARYERFARAIARYEQALDLWADNAPARLGARRARLAHAREALARGDLGLAAAQAAPLPADDAEARALRAELEAAQAERAAAARRARGLRIVAGVSVTAALAALGAGYVLVSRERDRAVDAQAAEARERERAEKNEQAAKAAQAAAQQSAREARDRLRHLLTQRSQSEQDPAVGALHLVATLGPDLDPEADTLQRLRVRDLLERGTPAARTFDLGWSEAALSADDAEGAYSAVFDAQGRLWALERGCRVGARSRDDPTQETVGAPIELPPLGEEGYVRTSGRLVAAGERLLVDSVEDLAAIDLATRRVAWTYPGGMFVVVDPSGRRLALLTGEASDGVLLDVATGKALGALPNPGRAVPLQLVGLAGDRVWAHLLEEKAVAWFDLSKKVWTRVDALKEVDPRTCEVLLGPDGDLVAASGALSSGKPGVAILDAATGATLTTLANEANERVRLAWLGARRVAVLRFSTSTFDSGELSLTVLDAETGEATRLATAVPRHADHPALIASPDGRALAVTAFLGLRGQVHVIGAVDGWPVCPPLLGLDSTIQGGVEPPSFSPDGGLFAAVDAREEHGRRGPVRVWALGAREGPVVRGVIPPLTPEQQRAQDDERIEPGHALNISIVWPDRYVDPMIDLSRRADGQAVVRLEGIPPLVDPSLAPSGEEDEDLGSTPEKLDALLTGSLLAADQFHNPRVHVVTTRDGRHAAVCFGTVELPPTDQVPPSGRFRVRVYDVAAKAWLPFERLGSAVSPTLRFTPDGARLVLLWDGAVEAIDVPSGRVARIDLPPELLDRQDVYADAFLRVSRTVPFALAAGAGGAAVVSLGEAPSAGPLQRLGGVATDAALFDDERRGYVASAHEVLVFDLASRSLAFPVLRIAEEVEGVVVSPDGRHLVTVGLHARVFDLATGLPVGGPMGVDTRWHGLHCQVAFAPSGGLVALARAGSLQLWELASALPVSGVVTLPGLFAHEPRFEDGARTLVALESVGEGPVREVAWALEPDARPLEQLRADVELRARRRLDASGYPVPLGPEEEVARRAVLGAARVVRPPRVDAPVVTLEAPAPGARTAGRWTPLRARVTGAAPGARAVVWARTATGRAAVPVIVAEGGLIDVPGVVLPRGGDAVRLGVRVVGANGVEGGASVDVTVGPLPPATPPAGARRVRAEDARGAQVEVWERALPAGGALELVRVPAGPFRAGIGGADQTPARVGFTPADLWVARTEVTWGQYLAFCAATGRAAPAARPADASDLHPVTSVTWEDAAAFAAWAGGALPTADEWEHAARGPDGPLYPWGDEWQEKRSNHGTPREGPDPADGFAGAAPVGSFADDVSSLGVRDVAGNVAEWCADVVDEGGQEGEYGEITPRRCALRGGSFSNGSWLARLAQPNALDAAASSERVGFRIVYRSR
jgi:formylglycine-generating enzyme required for sulfatase activity/tRNA A-37 threonylcarbamoyl transferase component Bud32